MNEIFPSLQGEGDYSGHPVTFVRLSGCTRECSFCDTKYHEHGDNIPVEEIISKLQAIGLEKIVWTGGEPTLQIGGIINIMHQLKGFQHHLETNGDINIGEHFNRFNYVSISPKSLEIAKKVMIYPINTQKDIKVVTDLKMNRRLIPYATSLMPLTTESEKKNIKIEQDVWDYCVKNNLKFNLREHVHVWGTTKRGI